MDVTRLLGSMASAVRGVGLEPMSLVAGAASSDGATTTSISAPALLLGHMQQLARADPAKFQQVAAEVAGSLGSAASQVGGPQGEYLSNVARMFAQSSKTGTLALPQTPHAGQADAQRASSSPASGAGFGRLGSAQGGTPVASAEVDQAMQAAVSLVQQALQGTPAESVPTI